MDTKSPDPLAGGSLDNVRFTPFDHVYNRSQALLGIEPNPLMQPVRFGGSVSSETSYYNEDTFNSPSDLNEFREYLRTFAESLTDPSAVRFAIANYGGQWWGTGLENYYTAFESTRERYERDRGKMEYKTVRQKGGWTTGTWHTETAACLGTLSGGSQVVLTHEAESGEGTNRKTADMDGSDWEPRMFQDGKVVFMTDGYPVDPTRFVSIAEQLGVDLETAMMREIDLRKVDFRPQHTVTPVEFIPHETTVVDGSPLIENVIVENPYYRQPDALPSAEVKSVKTYNTVETWSGSDPSKWMELLTGLKYFPVRVSAFRDEFDTDSVRINRLRTHHRLDVGGFLQLTVHVSGAAV